MMETQSVTALNNLANTFPEIAAEWHPTKNGSLTPDQVSPAGHRMVWWKCAAHGHEYEARICSRVVRGGCPKCQEMQEKANDMPRRPRRAGAHFRQPQKKELRPGVNDLKSQYPKLAAEWHQTKNRNWLPSQVIASSVREVWWRCPSCGHAWQARISDRVDGAACPNCHRTREKAKTDKPASTSKFRVILGGLD